MALISEVKITEAYRNYKPAVNVAKVVRRLLAGVPDQYVRGLDCIVLSNMSGQPRRNRLGKITSRGKRIPKHRVLGLYHAKWKGRPPWIELYVDRILAPLPKWTQWISFLRDFAVARVLYHELGHHVHLFVRPEYREKEDVANDWRSKFIRPYMRKKFWYLIPFARIYKLIRHSSEQADTNKL